MSRVIEFRGRSTSEVDAEGYAPPIKIGDWVYGSLITANGEAFIVNGVVESNWEYIALEEWCPVDPATVGQFTGLRDKNGAEIYEGDVLALVRCPFRHLSCTCEKRTDPHFISEVSFERGAFCVEGLSGDVSQYEVIGNIHEHPHLLESAS